MKGSTILLLLLLGAGLAKAQTINVTDIDVDNFPLVRAHFFATDATAKQDNDFEISDFRVFENGIERRVTHVSCPSDFIAPPSSTVFVIDNSGSMIQGNLDVAKVVARAWIGSMRDDGSDCAIVGFTYENQLYQDFTTSRDKLNTALDELAAKGGENFDSALINEPAGGLQVSRNAKHRRFIILLTDGVSTMQRQVEVIAEAQQQNCRIFCITLGLPCPDVLKEICDASDGAYFEDITTSEQARNAYDRIFAMTQLAAPCEIEWESDPSCGNFTEVELECLKYGLSVNKQYEIPVERRIDLRFTPEVLAFPNVQPGESAEKSVRIFADRGDFTIENISGFYGSEYFELLNADLPLTIKAGENFELQIRFSPPDSLMHLETFTFESANCQRSWGAWGGFAGQPTAQEGITLLYPNGGESFVAGNTTTIRWEGVPEETVVSLDFSPDNGQNWTVVADNATQLSYEWRVPNVFSDDCLIRVQQSGELGTNEEILEHDLYAFAGDVRFTDWSPNGKMLATGHRTGIAVIWDTESGEELFRLEANEGSVNWVRWSPDGKLLATTHIGKNVRIWDGTNGTLLHVLSGHSDNVLSAEWNFDSRKLVTYALDGTARVWDAQRGVQLYQVEIPTAATIHHISWSPFGFKLAVVVDFEELQVHDAESGGIIWKWTSSRDDITSTKWHPDGTKITVLTRNQLSVLEATNAKLLKTNFTTLGGAGLLSWSPDMSKVVSHLGDGSMGTIWNGETGAALRNFDGHSNQIFAVNWSPDGTKFGTASRDNLARIWDCATGRRLFDLTTHTEDVIHLAWSPSGTHVSTGSRDGIAKIIQLKTPLQSDQSDAVFSIEAPLPDAIDVDMGEALVGSARNRMVEDFHVNNGNWPYTVESISIGGEHSQDFELVAGLAPLEVDQTHFAEFSFRPSGVGERRAEIHIRTATEVLVRTIRGVGVEPPLELRNKLVVFGRTWVGDRRDSTIEALIHNSGDTPIDVTSIRFGGPNDRDFRLSNGARNLSFRLAPGESRDIQLSFQPREVGGTSGRLYFNYLGQIEPLEVQLFGTGFQDGVRALIRVEDIRAAAGEKTSLRISMPESENMSLSLAPTEWRATLRYNGQLLYSPRAVCDDDDFCTLEVTGTREPNSTDLLSLPVIATLGNTDRDAISIEEFSWRNGRIDPDTELQNGIIEVEGICAEGGLRLLQTGGASFTLIVRPLPARDNAEIQFGLRENMTVSLDVINSMGTTVASLLNNEDLTRGLHRLDMNVGSLAPGLYYVRLYGAQGSLFAQMVIAD